MEKKLIIISKSDQRFMTFEETLEQYQDLVYKMANGWSGKYEFEDVQQIATIGLWKAFEAYDSTKGLTFMTLAHKSMSNALCQFNVKHKPKFDNKTSKVARIVSLNVVAKNSKGFDGDQLAETISSNESFADQLIDRMFIQEITSHIPDEVKSDIEMNLAGYTYKEIAAERGCTGAWIGVGIRESFSMIRRRYAKEMNVGV